MTAVSPKTARPTNNKDQDDRYFAENRPSDQYKDQDDRYFAESPPHDQYKGQIDRYLAPQATLLPEDCHQPRIHDNNG